MWCSSLLLLTEGSVLVAQAAPRRMNVFYVTADAAVWSVCGGHHAVRTHQAPASGVLVPSYHVYQWVRMHRKCCRTALCNTLHIGWVLAQFLAEVSCTFMDVMAAMSAQAMHVLYSMVVIVVVSACNTNVIKGDPRHKTTQNLHSAVAASA